MEMRREWKSTAWGRVGYPVFSDDGRPKEAAEMNVFYTALTEAVLSYADALNQTRENGARILTADYRVSFEEGRVLVEYTLSLRRRGRTEARKLLCHLWDHGALIKPPKRRTAVGKDRRRTPPRRNG